ncbi:MAG: DUF3788 domain-containing protein [Bacteroidales bacterium]|nr:DUF3788 domain-containing protein [Bacteroidales bacterium]
MDDISIFRDKAIEPTEKDVMEKLGASYLWWKKIREFVMACYPAGATEWKYPGQKYGWNYRIRDKKRVIIYLLPRDNCFKVALVFGQKATDLVLGSEISAEIRDQLAKATKYAEGRGIRIDVKDEMTIADINKLILIKLEN